MYITILGRQPALGIAELEQLYGHKHTRWFSDGSALVDAADFDFERLGGSQKAGRVVAELSGDWRRVSMKLVSAYVQAWSDHEGKITLGISAYGFKASARDVQKTGIILKGKLKEKGVSLRLIPNTDMALNTATSHHNKLGLSDNHVELLVVRASNGKVIIAESIGAQNITALARRDQERPKRDAFVGMLPPKLARMMVNYTGIKAPARILDPFCGTGVLPQEAALLGYDTYATDLVDKMIDFTKANMEWLATTHHTETSFTAEQGDAMTHHWQQPIDAVACETYLGQPFSAPPSPGKLEEVRGNCNHIISRFLSNLAEQLSSGTPLCVAIPAWRDNAGSFTHLPLIAQLDKLGYTEVELHTVRNDQLLYYREDQIVARELLLLKKS
jgi:tRNA (guanine10-N2)-dimethyltransferase